MKYYASVKGQGKNTGQNYLNKEFGCFILCRASLKEGTSFPYADDVDFLHNVL